ncbi:MAG: ammonia-forming cytochrome c nitrite reductase subunit c552 [Planctomycetes bacterium]|nr:ammonia-forming cytochrome c nitrite reductase subunit c552 [Planctomycetota bacterium]
MSNVTPSTSRWPARIIYLATILVTAAAAVAITYLLTNISDRQHEAQQRYVVLENLTEDSIDPTLWRKNFPRQYDGYMRTADMVRAKHAGSDAIDKLAEDKYLKHLYAGYAFSIDYREKRGHAYMLKDQEDTERVKQKKQPGACLHCHAAIMPVYRKEGGGDSWEQIKEGFRKVCEMDWNDAHKLVSHPVVCADCHDPKTVQLRVTRPAFIMGIQALAQSDDKVPHLPSVERWRTGNKKSDYDPNKDASRQELRTLVCAQCHVEYYFQPKTNLLIYPWHKGLKMDQIEEYYDTIDFKDWTHKDSGAPMLKAQHPEFELWSQGIHARSGVSCADCHMPYMREGAVKISDHHVRSPLLNIARACQTCHRQDEKEMRARVDIVQDRTRSMLKAAEIGVKDLIDALKSAKAKGVAEARLKPAQALHRKAQWRLDFVMAENSMSFHAPQESARILGEAVDYARQGQITLLKE